eukprot:3376158-Rhodomonas_salina.1
MGSGRGYPPSSPGTTSALLSYPLATQCPELAQVVVLRRVGLQLPARGPARDLLIRTPSRVSRRNRRRPGLRASVGPFGVIAVRKQTARPLKNAAFDAVLGLVLYRRIKCRLTVRLFKSAVAGVSFNEVLPHVQY